MAAMISIFSLLVLVLVQSTHSAIILPEPKTSIASPCLIVHRARTTPSSSKPTTWPSHPSSPPSITDTRPCMEATSSSRILYAYGTVMHGFAVRLSSGEARHMSAVPGVTRGYKDSVYHTQTTRSPWFMGLHDDFGAWPDSEFGDGTIIGFIDSGIWLERASFNDTGLGPVRPTWRGECVDADGFNASLSCNNKLVGAKSCTINMTGYMHAYNDPSPRDFMGHGTHVASTAAGAEVPWADLYGFSGGRASGVARNAGIAMYKACVPVAGCPDSAVVAAIDAAVSDGVYLISLSLSRKHGAFYDNPLAVATFGAVRRGVFVVHSGGNSGPIPSRLRCPTSRRG
ncbi:hypothetical protein QYE76_004370 [Lolium multiflorum]|uniref:Uncharacterized protein n=1 Tax=Lolium multiflorum TaxID=4521 RepID=A0AAD8RS31_LOLMU|nr:hypothetical protein QYE76_004370 [Lolium multiflorum]